MDIVETQIKTSVVESEVKMDGIQVKEKEIDSKNQTLENNEKEKEKASKKGMKEKNKKSKTEKSEKGSVKKEVVKKDDPFYSENPLLKRKENEKEWLAVNIHGHGHSKVIVGKLGDLKPYKLPVQSTVLMIDEGNDYSRDGFYFEEATKDWEGKSFIRDGSAEEHLMNTQERGKIKYQLALVVDSLWDSIREGDTIYYVGAVHLKHWNTHLYDAVEGTHTVRKGNEEKTFTIIPYRIYVEGTGVRTYYQLTTSSDKFSSCLVYDFGDGTSIATYFEGSKVMSSRSISGSGFRQVIGDLGALPQLLQLLEADSVINYFELVEGIKNPKRGKYFLRGKDVTEIFNQFFTNRARTLIERTKKSQEEQYRNAQRKLACGGGLLVPAIRKVFEEEGFKVVADPLWADAVGLYKVCQSRISKEGVKGMERPVQAEVVNQEVAQNG